MIEALLPIPAVGHAYVQATTTGEWESATRLVASRDADAFLTGSGARPATVAVELLWEGPPVSFVGTRLTGVRVTELPDLVERLTMAGLSPGAALSALSGGDLGPVLAVECGAVNAWGSVGPVRLWAGGAWREPDALLAARPNLRVGPHPVALEVAHHNAWYAVQVSRPRGPDHILDPTRLHHLTGLVRDRVPR